MNASAKINLLLFSLCSTPLAAQDQIITLQARSYDQTSKQEVLQQLDWDAKQTAIIICDMWDKHWCATATERVSEMAPLMNQVITHARKRGVTIVHAPSNTMEFYEGTKQRKRILKSRDHPSSEQIEDWYYIEEKEGALPIDDTDGGCDDPTSDCVHCKMWSRQIDALEIHEKDVISDSSKEINNYFLQKGIENVIIMGVHTNMCVLGRSFGIRGQIKQGRNTVLVRDLTDTMYNPKMPPMVSHEEGTNLVIRHVETYWCPSITSEQLLHKS